MSLRVLTALGHDWESGFVTSLEASSELTVVRRCADLADLLAACSAGRADVAVLAGDLRQLDRDSLQHLAHHGVRAVGAVPPGDEGSERKLRQLGIQHVLRSDAATDEIEQTITAVAAGPMRGAAGGPGGIGPGGISPAGDVRAPATVARGNSGAHRIPAVVLGNSADPSEPIRGRIIAIWGPAGSPGRTTLAVNVAAEIAAAGTPTLLVDCDTYGSSIGQALSMLDEAPGMAAAARASELGSLDLPSLARLAPQVSPGLRVLTGIPRADRWPELRASAIEDILGLARSLAEVIVVDCGFSIEDDEELSYDTLAPRRNAATLTSLEHADELLVVGSGDPVGLQRLVRAIQDIGALPSPPPRVVVNRVRASAVGSRPEQAITDALSRFAGMEHLVFVPHDLETLDAAMLAGQSLAESAPQSAVRTAIAAIAASCLPGEPVDVPSARRSRVLLRR